MILLFLHDVEAGGLCVHVVVDRDHPKLARRAIRRCPTRLHSASPAMISKVGVNEEMDVSIIQKYQPLQRSSVAPKQ
jgi:hypothetical protein